MIRHIMEHPPRVPSICDAKYDRPVLVQSGIKRQHPMPVQERPGHHEPARAACIQLTQRHLHQTIRLHLCQMTIDLSARSRDPLTLEIPIRSPFQPQDRTVADHAVYSYE